MDWKQQCASLYVCFFSFWFLITAFVPIYASLKLGIQVSSSPLWLSIRLMIFHIYISGPCCILTSTGWFNDLPFLETLLDAVLSALTWLWLERCQEMFCCVNAIIHNIISRPNPFTKNAYYRNSCSCYTHDLQTPSQYNAQPWTINNHSTSARWIWVAYSDIISSKCGRIIVSLSRVTAVFSRAVFVLQLAFLRDWSKHRLDS